ncbi:NTP transferase domain-containing protein [Flagellimonas sp. DF-77]|uniref:NTP transferase domain-containing protein n=1 Tax=Flagellimonas algarum TaxID=3230298 RepID=UPI003392FFBC
MGHTAELFSLILAGGRSSRMGTDKGRIRYHGKPQRQILFHLASEFTAKVWYSVREEQRHEFDESAPLIIDTNRYKGPFNGILSAHLAHPEVAWLVMACDLPFLDKDALDKLIAHRKRASSATAYASKASGLPEPLISIWEPSTLRKAMVQLASGSNLGPRSFLIQENAYLVYPDSDKILYNANTPKDYALAKSLLS